VSPKGLPNKAVPVKILEFDLHAENSIEVNLAPVAKVLCGPSIAFLKSVEESLTADMEWYQKIGYNLALTAAGLYVNVFNPQDLKADINAVSK
jgi:hypothetical protein